MSEYPKNDGMNPDEPPPLPPKVVRKPDDPTAVGAGRSDDEPPPLPSRRVPSSSHIFDPVATVPQPIVHSLLQQSPPLPHSNEHPARDRILAREIAKVGAISGAVGGTIRGGVLAGAAGAVASAHGAWIAARFLPTESYVCQHMMPCDARKALTVIVNALAGLGRLQDSAEINSSNPTVVAVIGSGVMNINPCMIAIEIVSHSDKETVAIIRGGAKEGLIKQHTAAKAVKRVVEAIQVEAPLVCEAVEQGAPTAKTSLQQFQAHEQQQLRTQNQQQMPTPSSSTPWTRRVLIGALVGLTITVIRVLMRGNLGGSSSPAPNTGYQLPPAVEKFLSAGGSSQGSNNGYRPSYNQGDAYDRGAERAIQNMRDAGTYTPQAAQNARNMSRIGRELEEKQRREMP